MGKEWENRKKILGEFLNKQIRLTCKKTNIFSVWGEGPKRKGGEKGLNVHPCLGKVLACAYNLLQRNCDSGGEMTKVQNKKRGGRGKGGSKGPTMKGERAAARSISLLFPNSCGKTKTLGGTKRIQRKRGK